MRLTLLLPRQRTTAPILAVSILLGLLLSPVLERALESWMPVAPIAPTEQNSGSHGNPGKGGDNSASWELRSRWN
jgi:hypothetical protein